MKRSPNALFAALLLASGPVLADPPGKAPGPPQGSGAAAPKGGNVDDEHPPLGKEAVERADRESAAREEARSKEAARAAAERKAQNEARERAERKAASDAPDVLPVEEGRYRGVALEGKNPPPGHKPGAGRKARGGGAQLTWLGFRVEEGIPAVFVELSQPVVWSVDERPGSLTYTLQGVKVPLRNNLRPIDASGFGTHVQGAVVSRRGHDVLLTITGRGAARLVHREHNRDAPEGYKFLVIELPST